MTLHLQIQGADEYQKLSHRFKLIDHDPKTYQQIGVQESFCGKINSWAPKTRTWAGSADFGAEGMEAASTGNLRDFPASCTKVCLCLSLQARQGL
jgi:hypothetical protein